MAVNPRNKLRSWAEGPSKIEDGKRDETVANITLALRNSSALAGVRYEVYVKGSYANSTNVRLDCDVDIAVELKDFFYRGVNSDSRGTGTVADQPSDGIICGGRWQTFKDQVWRALVDHYERKGRLGSMSRGNIAMRIDGKPGRGREWGTLSADVVPCFEYRDIYTDEHGNEVFHRGTRVYGDNGGYKYNWPIQHYEQGEAKDKATLGNYKRMVRVLKRLENELVIEGVIEEQPSFLMECLTYNVPNHYFMQESNRECLEFILGHIHEQTSDHESCRNWREVSERKLLFNPSQKWTREQVNYLARVALSYIR